MVAHEEDVLLPETLSDAETLCGAVVPHSDPILPVVARAVDKSHTGLVNW